MGRRPELKSLIGLVPAAVGLVFCYLSVIDPRDHPFPSGQLPVLAAGLVFLFAGLAILINGLKIRYRGTFLGVNGIFLLASFTAVPIGIMRAKGPTLVLVLSALGCLSFLVVCIRATIVAYRRERSASP